MPGVSKLCWRSAMIPLPQLTGAALENRNVAETAFDTPLPGCTTNTVAIAGWRDLVCPIDTMRYALEHRQLDDACRTNITCAKFDAAT
jgi:hypothetical protein